jgi:hypothetical protein
MRALVLGCVLGCGRVGFDPPATSDATHGGIVHVGAFVARDPGGGTGDSFQAAASAGGDTIVLQVVCRGPAPSAVSLNAPGWSFVHHGSILGSPSVGLYGAIFSAIAPNANPTTIDLAWTGTTCDGQTELGDEFSGVGAVANTSANESTGNCLGQVQLDAADGAVWAACTSLQNVLAVGPGYTKSADDSNGDWTEYKLTQDPAGTVEPVAFTNQNFGYVLSIVALPPR